MATDQRQTRFDPGVGEWRDRIGQLRDQVRQELVRLQLQEVLDATIAGDRALRVLDAGCGQGTQVIHLARAGHDVVGIDRSETMLRDASESAGNEPASIQRRIELVSGDVSTIAARYAGQFDLVCCHGVVMYLDSLDEAVASLASALRPGGLLSLLSRNRAGIAMRAGMTGDWSGAVAGFDARHYANRLGITGTRADEPEEVAGAFGSAGLDVVAWFGVRLFTDHIGDVPPPDDFDALLAAEAEAGRRDPYRQLAALTHTIGRARG